MHGRRPWPKPPGSERRFWRTRCCCGRPRTTCIPICARVVQFDIEPGAGTVLLTLSQADDLRTALDNLDLRGTVAVSLVDALEARRADGRRDLIVAGHVVSLGRPLEALSVIYDAIPTAFVMSTLWFLPQLSDTREGVPVSATLLPVVLTTGGGVVVGGQGQPGGPGTSPPLGARVRAGHGDLHADQRHQGTHPAFAGRRVLWFPWMLALQGYELVTEQQPARPICLAGQLRIARLRGCSSGDGGVGLLAPPTIRTSAAERGGVASRHRHLGQCHRPGHKRDAESLATEIRTRMQTRWLPPSTEGRRRVLDYLASELQDRESENSINEGEPWNRPTAPRPGVDWPRWRDDLDELGQMAAASPLFIR